jgi:O-antigen/teichoic acid export membrane protein
VRGSDDPRVMWWFLLIGSLGAFVLLTVSSILAARIVRIRASWDPETMKRVLGLALPFGLAYLCMALYRNMDVTLIALLRPDFQTQNALYGFALRANEMAFLLPTFLLNSTLPLVSKRLDAGEDVTGLVRKTFVMIAVLSITAGLTAMAWARPLMQLLTTEQYLSTFHDAGADTALFLLGPSMILNGIVLFCFYTLLAIGESKRLTWSLAIAAVASQILNVLLIPEFGFVGAAVTSLVVHMLIALLLLTPTLRKLHIKDGSLEGERIGAYALLLAIGLLALRPFLVDELHTGLGILALGVLAAFFVEILGIRRVVTRG